MQWCSKLMFCEKTNNFQCINAAVLLPLAGTLLIYSALNYSEERKWFITTNTGFLVPELLLLYEGYLKFRMKQKRKQLVFGWAHEPQAFFLAVSQGSCFLFIFLICFFPGKTMQLNCMKNGQSKEYLKCVRVKVWVAMAHENLMTPNILVNSLLPMAHTWIQPSAKKFYMHRKKVTSWEGQLIFLI